MPIIDTHQARIYNLRHELARTLWAVRRNPIDLIELNENISTLVSLCPAAIIEAADILAHAVKNQIQKYQGNHYYRLRGVDERIRVHAIRAIMAVRCEN